MPYITVGEENSAPIELFYEDHGTGAAIVDNDGLDRTLFDGFIEAARADRPAFMTGFLSNFYRVLPPPHTGDRLPELITDLTHTVIEGGPHGIVWTHADQVNSALLGFLQ